MSKESCIQHPANSYFVKIYDYQMEMFNKDKSICALLSLFESYHNSLLYTLENKKRMGIPTDDTDLFQYHSYRQLEERVFGIGSKPTIVNSIKLLSEKKIISIINDEEISNYNSNLIFMQKVKNKSNPNIYRFNDDVFNDMISEFLKDSGVKFLTPSGKDFNTPLSNFLPTPVKILTPLGKNFNTHNQNRLDHNKNKPNLNDSKISIFEKEEKSTEDAWSKLKDWSKTHLTRSSCELINGITYKVDGQAIFIQQPLSDFLKQIILKFFNEEITPSIIIIFEDEKQREVV